ncbi:MAG TPA: hypothetical protein VHI32_01325 [Burkholderiales bacterium]|nr:hypothetical protein [Burkholderiales bacterium]
MLAGEPLPRACRSPEAWLAEHWGSELAHPGALCARAQQRADPAALFSQAGVALATACLLASSR